MAAWALAAALLACGLAVAALVAVVRLRRLIVGRAGRRNLYQEDELLREAWLEEIEARGQAVLARIAAAEENWLRAQRERQVPMSPPPGQGEEAGPASQPTGADGAPAAHGPAQPVSGPGGGGPTDAGRKGVGAAAPRDAAAAGDDVLAEAVGGRRRLPGAARADGGLAASAAPAAVVAQVRSLAAQGLDAAGIARRLGIGRGEVELILNLSQPDRG
ncbi:MAG TPA: hypothetical protein VIK93_01990 [Limnochordales bacterium]